MADTLMKGLGLCDSYYFCFYPGGGSNTFRKPFVCVSGKYYSFGPCDRTVSDRSGHCGNELCGKCIYYGLGLDYAGNFQAQGDEFGAGHIFTDFVVPLFLKCRD